MKKKLFLILFLFNLNTIYSQSFVDICNNLCKNEFVTGDYTLEQKNSKVNKIITTKGNYILSLNDGIIWKSIKPIKSVTVYTNNYILQEFNGKQKKLDGKNSKIFVSIAKTISSVFTGNYNELKNNFEIDFIKLDKDETGVNKFNVSLTPTESNLKIVIEKIELIITENFEKNNKNFFIKNLTIYNTNGDFSNYILENNKILTSLEQKDKEHFEK